MKQLAMKLASEFAASCGFYFGRCQAPNFLTPFLYALLAQKEIIQFIQIGANDGITGDPLHRFIAQHHRRMKGVLLEPQPDIFITLKECYKRFPEIVPRNIALHPSEKEMILYRVNPSFIDENRGWARGIASFDRNNPTFDVFPGGIIEELVPCKTLREILDDAEFKHLDLLQIDAEGFDSEIIRSIEFNEIKPLVIRFEHGLANNIMARESFECLLSLLESHGYEFVIEHYDAIAYQRTLLCETLK